MLLQGMLLSAVFCSNSCVTNINFMAIALIFSSVHLGMLLKRKMKTSICSGDHSIPALLYSCTQGTSLFTSARSYQDGREINVHWKSAREIRKRKQNGC